MDWPRPRSAPPTAQLKQGHAGWYRINKTADAAKIYLYDVIGGWDGITAKNFMDELGEITASQIELHLNTPGGDVYDGFAIYQALREHPAKVTSVVDAAALSIGSVIAMAGDTISIAKVGQIMIHDAFALTIGDAEEHRKTAGLLEQISDTIAEVYADRTGAPTAFWRDAMRAESWYTAEEAVKAGLADEIRSGKGKDAEDSWDLSRYRYSGRRQAPPPMMPSAHRPAAVAPMPAPIHPESPPAPAPVPPATVASNAVAVPWDAELAELFRAVVAGHAERAPAPPEQPPPPPAPTGPTDLLIDPIVFHNAIREATRAQ